MASEFLPRVPALGVYEQRAHLRRVWPALRCDIHDGMLECRGVVQPSPLTNAYRIHLRYKVHQPPRVWVKEPVLRRRDPSQRIPHTYLDDDGTERPCLYLPGAGEWRQDKALAITVMPWLLLWLTYYELWLATGEWHGGGVEHPVASDRAA